MAISTNSIIHYTSSFKVLSLIIKEGFKINYCSEVLKLGNGSSAAAHPMITFCDIPLSNSSQHFNAYGSYGLGLTKEWAVKNGVNPVIYIDNESLIAESIYSLIKERRDNRTNLTDKQKTEILQIKSYAKNYKGTLKRNGKPEKKDYIFYNEREWRLIPPDNKIQDNSFSVSLKKYRKDKRFYNSKLDKIRYEFDITDISYIIVKKTSEISKMIKYLSKIFHNKSNNDLNILFSKVCSTEQILSDY